MDTIDWLLDTDPALRWQVERDLVDAPEDTWRATRARVATEGIGAAVLAHQDPDGTWAGGAHFPKDFRGGPDDGQPWTATSWSLSQLREWGVEPEVLRAGTVGLLDRNCRWEYDDLPFWGGEVDVCINAMTLANGSWLGRDMTGLARWFVDHELTGGGWNCEWIPEGERTVGSVRASFHSTINALLGIDDHQARVGHDAALDAAVARAEEYLLDRELRHRLSTGEDVGPWVDQFAYPPRWVYSILRGVEHFRLVGRRDERLAAAVETVRSKQQPDGRWLQDFVLKGATWLDVDVPSGEPSPWVTFQCLRVLRWWDQG